MDSLLLAVQFLTVLPLKIKEVNDEKMAHAMIFFPFVGLLIGLIIAGVNSLLIIFNLPSLAVNIILAVVLIWISGGMHLDGLSDTADAVLSARPRDEMLAIMRDPHIGVMGVLSLVSVVLLKIGLLYSVDTGIKTMALVLMCVVSRWSAVWMMFLFPYARRDGKARVFIQGMKVKILILSLIVSLVCAYALWRQKGILVMILISGVTYLWGKNMSRKLGGITGDTLGAAIELTEITALFFICIA